MGIMLVTEIRWSPMMCLQQSADDMLLRKCSELFLGRTRLRTVQILQAGNAVRKWQSFSKKHSTFILAGLIVDYIDPFQGQNSPQMGQDVKNVADIYLAKDSCGLIRSKINVISPQSESLQKMLQTFFQMRQLRTEEAANLMTIESLLLTKNDLLQDIDCVIMIPQSYGVAEGKESLKHDARFYF